MRFAEIAIAEEVNVSLKIPEGTIYSFFDSPYIGHRNETAIDIYFKDREALLPVDEAIVKEIRWFNSPKYRPDGSEKEPLIVFKIREGVVLKTLHVKPKVNVGERLHLGDYIGECIVSGYLCPWSGIHAHIEVRPERDPYRARGAYKLNIEPTVRKILAEIGNANVKFSEEPLVFNVVSVEEHYMWIKFRNDIGGKPTALMLMSEFGEICAMDAGIPYYGIGGCLGRSFKQGEKLLANKKNIVGLVTKSYEQASLFTSIAETYVGKVKVRGVGTYIGTDLAKIVFLEEKPWKEGDEEELVFKQIM